MNNLLTDYFSEPLTCEMFALVDIRAGGGNLQIDSLPKDEQLLAGGALQYFEKQSLPIRTRESTNGQAILSLVGSGMERPWIRFPWAACNGATKWQIHLNPTVMLDIKAHSDGGNIQMNLAGMAISCVSADTGGGNIDLALPDCAENLNVAAKTGAGNVTVDIGHDITGSSLINASSGAGNVLVYIPSDAAALIHTTIGLGKAIVDQQFRQIDPHTYKSQDYEDALNKVEVWAKSGAGSVIVETK